MSAAPGHGKDVVVAAGVEVQRCWAWLICIDQLQRLFELSASRVFTLKGAQGVESIQCDGGVRPLLQQRSQ